MSLIYVVIISHNLISYHSSVIVSAAVVYHYYRNFEFAVNLFGIALIYIVYLELIGVVFRA